MLFSTLNNLEKGGIAQVSDLKIQGELRQRLMDMGITPGTGIECLFSSPKKQISAYLVRDSVIALRCEDAEGIVIIPKGVRK